MKQVRVGIVGFGTVGRATADIITHHSELIQKRSGVKLVVTAVCRRQLINAADVPHGARVTTGWKELLTSSDVDVIVETMGGVDHSLQLLRGALEHGKPVVTANKKLLAEHGDELFALAVGRNLPIGFEASVAGGIPILRVIQESTAGDRLRALHGILNGTSNYILTQMESRGIDFDQALSEADPTFDIDGQDARDKLCILARMAFGGRLDVNRIPAHGIRAVRAVDIRSAQRLNRTIRLVASAEQTGSGLDVSVRPWLVDSRSMLAKVEDVNNAVFLVGDRLGTQMFYGRGAGGDATGAAVVSDLVEIARDLAAGRLSAKNVVGFLDPRELEIAPEPKPAGWYLRLTVHDQRGIIARVAETLASDGMNIDSVQQEPHSPKERLSLFFTVEPISEPKVRAVIEKINAFEFMVEPVLLLRME